MKSLCFFDIANSRSYMENIVFERKFIKPKKQYKGLPIAALLLLEFLKSCLLYSILRKWTCLLKTANNFIYFC